MNDVTVEIEGGYAWNGKYSTALQDCDVQDQYALAQYREKRSEWLSWYSLDKEEPNSIQNQIFLMLLLDLSYRTLTFPRQLFGQAINASASPVLAHYMDVSYVANQVSSIRKLLDKGKDVISLRKMLDDIRANSHLITREIYVSHNGLPYDPNSWSTDPAYKDDTLTKMMGIDAPGLIRYLRSTLAHQEFDQLSGVLPANRTRFDRIRTQIFDKLEKWIDDSDAAQIILLGNKYIAHAANKKSRGPIANNGVKLTHIQEVHRAIIRVERAITDHILLLGIARKVVPMQSLTYLANLRGPVRSSLCD